MPDNQEDFKEAMEAARKKAEIIKALAHPVRIRVFEALAEEEKTAGDLVTITGEKEANTSRHLAVLRAAGLVSTRKDGLHVYYSNSMPCLMPMLDCIEEAVCAIADEHMKASRCMRQ